MRGYEIGDRLVDGDRTFELREIAEINVGCTIMFDGQVLGPVTLDARGIAHYDCRIQRRSGRALDTHVNNGSGKAWVLVQGPGYGVPFAHAST